MKRVASLSPRSLPSTTALAAMIVVLAIIRGTSAQAQRFTSVPYGTPAGSSPTADLLRDVGIEQHLDTQLPLDAVFRDETGREVKLGDYFGEQPVVVALVYYRCPMLCTQVLNGFLKSSQAVPLEIGRDYQVVTVSFDPRETPELAAEKKASYVRAYRRDGAAQGWHFLTGDRQSIDRLTEAIGFHYRFDPKSDQFAHASGIALATPGGRLAVTSTASSIRLTICGWVWSKVRRGGSDRSSTRCCCSASTTTR